MPLRRRVQRKRRVMRKRRAARGRGGRLARFRRTGMNAMKDRATVVEVQENQVVPEGGQFINHTLSDFPRALAVSKQYRFYRCKKVEVEFIPYANLFPGGTAFPELYCQVERTQGTQFGPSVPLPLPTKGIMMSRGVMPVKWTSIVKRSYSPSVLRSENFIQNVLGSDVQSVAAITSTPVLYKWYATQQYFQAPPGNAASAIDGTWGPSLLRYFGMAYCVDQPLAEPSAVLGTIKIKVHWEFKEPLVAAEPTPPAAIGEGIPLTN